MKNNRKWVLAGVCGLLFAVLLLLVRVVDVAPIGPEGTCVGLSHLNQAVFGFFGVNLLWYEITDWLGIAAILTALLFAVTGLVQLIRRKSLLKVDRELLVLGGLYCLVIGLYVLFEFAVVNYRPIIMPGAVHPEASFPSSHTLLVCVVMGSAGMLTGKYIRGKALRRVLQSLCAGMIGITLIGRLVSGVHWFTDVLGGVLVSAALLALFSAIIDCCASRSAEKGDSHAVSVEWKI